MAAVSVLKKFKHNRLVKLPPELRNMEEPIGERFRRTQSVLDLVNESEHDEMAEQPKSAAAVADLIKILLVKYKDLVDGTAYNPRGKHI